MPELLIANPQRCAHRLFAQAARPAPRVDLNKWAVEHLEFGPDSPYPGPYDPTRLPFFRRVLEVLAPDHPCRQVVLLKSAQLGGTLLAQIFVAASMDLDPGGILHIHPTEPNASGYARTKWRPMLRSCHRLGQIFELRQSKEGGNSTLHQERRDGRGWLRLSGANSAASLSMYSVKRLVKDDLSKWIDNEAGDPEAQAESRTKAFRDAKILAIGTGLLKGSCRTTAAFTAGTQEHWHVPCPHCGHKHPLEPENFVANIDPEQPEKSCFTCPACGGVIEEKHRAEIVAAGEWVAHKAGAADISFYVWAAYAPFEPWERIARGYLAAKDDPKSEQVFWNDTAGRAYELPGEAPAWEELKQRAEAGQRPRGIVPIGALLLTLSLDCQDDYVDGVVMGWGKDLRRWVIDRVRIEGHISTPEARAELNQLVDRPWPTAGLRVSRRVDLIGIDANAFTDEVFDWARTFPKWKVIMLRGVGGDAAPALGIERKERRRDGRLVKYHGRFFNVGVSGLKAGLYKFLRVADPDQRGYVDFPAGLEDDFYEQLTAEKRTAVIDRRGFTVYQWTKARSQRNEMLDVAVYGEALAGKLGWRTLTPAGWAALEAEKEIAAAPVAGQIDLFAAAASSSLPIGSKPPILPSPTAMAAQPAGDAKPEPPATMAGWISRFAGRQLG